MRHISLDLIRVTEAAAIAASNWIGSGNKEEADKAATDAMRARLNKMNFKGRIAIGEGIKDNSYGLFKGEEVGAGTEEKWYDIAVDPIEGTRPTVNSGPEAIATLAVAHEGCFKQIDSFYMNKIAYGPRIRKRVSLSIHDPIERTIALSASALNKQKEHIVVCVLDRPRHSKLIHDLRELGVKIKLIQDCDVSGAVATCMYDTDVDLLMGIGGAPESVISAAAIKCMGGDFQAQISIKQTNDTWRTEGPVCYMDDLVKGPCIFVATGITNGSLLRGVRWYRSPTTYSVFMRSESNTVRWLRVNHGN